MKQGMQDLLPIKVKKPTRLDYFHMYRLKSLEEEERNKKRKKRKRK